MLSSALVVVNTALGFNEMKQIARSVNHSDALSVETIQTEYNSAFRREQQEKRMEKKQTKYNMKCRKRLKNRFYICYSPQNRQHTWIACTARLTSTTK